MEAWFTDSGRSSISNPSGRLIVDVQGTLRLRLDLFLEWYLPIERQKFGLRSCYPCKSGLAIFSRLLRKGHPMVGTFIQLSGGLGPDGLASNPWDG